MIQKLGKNKGAYHGKTIVIENVLRDCIAAAARFGWQTEKIEADENLKLLVFKRPPANVGRRIYISTGIHGDEPAGPLALCRLLSEDLLPKEFDYTVCPCLNPAGFPLNRRENAAGHDLNRDYRHLRSAEIRAHIAWLERQPRYDLCFCLHEDWEAHGFYLYELNPDNQPSLAEKMLAAVAPVCPIDPSAIIEGREAKAGIIRPSLDPASRPEWPEAFYLFQHKTRQCYTLEAPSDFPLPTRVNALVAAIQYGLTS